MLKLSNVSSLVMVKMSLDIAFYDPIDKKLIRSRDVVFFKDQTIEDIDKTEKLDSHTDESLVDVDPILLLINPLHMREPKVMIQIIITSVEHINVPTYDVVVYNEPTHSEITTSNDPETSCRRSTREKRSSTRYFLNEYILLTDIGEP